MEEERWHPFFVLAGAPFNLSARFRHEHGDGPSVRCTVGATFFVLVKKVEARVLPLSSYSVPEHAPARFPSELDDVLFFLYAGADIQEFSFLRKKIEMFGSFPRAVKRPLPQINV